MRRLPGPADCRLSEGDPCSRGSLRIVSGLAVNTNSIFCDGHRSLRQQMDVRFCESRNPCREAFTRTIRPDITHCALSRARPIHLCLPLTTDWVENRVLQAGSAKGSTR
jgi:hypothetical protein